MRAPLEWLSQYCDPGLAPREVEERLTMTGTKVEAVHHHGVDVLEHYVVGKVLEHGRHPDADRLSVCKVDIGGGYTAQIVCGAPNVAAELCLAELRAARHRRAGERHGDGLAGGDVGGTADDRPVPLAGVDLTYPQAIRVRMLLRRDHSPDDEPLRRRRAHVVDPLDLRGAHGEEVGKLLRRQARIAVARQPAVGDPHRNCSRTRTSFSKNLRRSGTPCLSIAIRSIPMPNAKPWTLSGS